MLASCRQGALSPDPPACGIMIPMDTETTWMERYTAAREAYYAIKDEVDAWYDERIREEYAAMRAADKAAGRDTSGKSVADRRRAAYDVVMMSDEARAKRDAVEVAYQAYRSVKAGP